MAQQQIAAAPWVPAYRRRGLSELVLRLLREKPLGTLGVLLVAGLMLSALLADFIAPYPYDQNHPVDRLQPPNSQYLLGTDNLGRDVLSRVLYGARISMTVALGAVGLATTIGVLMGIAAGYFEGKTDALLQRIVDLWMAFPHLVLLLTLMAFVGPGLINVIVILGLRGITESRVIRGAVYSIKRNSYMEAAQAIGCSNLRILYSYVLPNVGAPVIIIATLGLGIVILTEASLSFLGFGVPPPYPSWGSMLSGASRTYMQEAPWMAIWPGVALTLAVFGWNMLGDALRDLLDPRLRGGGGRFK